MALQPKSSSSLSTFSPPILSSTALSFKFLITVILIPSYKFLILFYFIFPHRHLHKSTSKTDTA